MKNFLKTVFASAFGFFIAQAMMFFLVIAVMVSVFNSQGVQNWSSGPKEVDTSKSRFLFFTPVGSLPDRLSFDSFDWLRSFDGLFRAKPMGMWKVVQALNRARQDEKIMGIYINLSYLNTNWAQANQLIRALKAFKNQKKIIYVYADHYSEVSYLVATIADRVFMNPLGSFELNGLGASSVFVRDLFKKLEVEPIIFRRGQFKSATEMFTERKMSEQNRRQVKALMAGIWQEYLTQVTKRRPKISKAQIEHWAGHLTISNAKEALERKVVDELLQESEVRTFIKEKHGLGSAVVVVKNSESNEASEDHFGKETLAVYMKSNEWSGQIIEQVEAKEKEKIGLLFLEGQIGGSSGDSEGISLPRVLKHLKEIREDSKVKALVVRINSPGGSAFDSDVIWAELRRLDAKIPVIISLGAIAASGGYYIASGGRYIFSEPTTITGSIGVFGIQFYTKEFFDKKLGVQFDQVVTHLYADMGASYRKVLDRERQVIEAQLDQIYSKFKGAVLATRPLKMDALEAVAQGRVWTGTQATEHKLVDALGGMEEAIAYAKKLGKLGDDYVVKEWPKDLSDVAFYMDILEGSLINYFGLKILGGDSLALSLLKDLRGATESWLSPKSFNLNSKGVSYLTLVPQNLSIR